MVYASSKDALRRGLIGIQVDIQATEADEVSYELGASPPSSPTTHTKKTNLMCPSSYTTVHEKCDKLR